MLPKTIKQTKTEKVFELAFKGWVENKQKRRHSRWKPMEVPDHVRCVRTGAYVYVIWFGGRGIKGQRDWSDYTTGLYS